MNEFYNESLMTEPGEVLVRKEIKIPILAETPENVPRTRSVPVVDLYDPVLVAHGHEQISVRG